MMMQASANVPSQEDRAVMPGGKLSRFSAAISSEQATRQHRIVEGESLESIAERHLGSATRASEIFQWNRDRLQQPDLLPLGIYLRIPPRWSEVATTQGGPETLPPDWAPVPPAIGSTPK
jgi:nucleoid-associated protein YgaU